MTRDELTPEERRAVDDYLSLTRSQRELLIEFSQFLDRPHRDDASIRNFDALIDLVRKRPALVDVVKRGEWWGQLRRMLLLVGGCASAIIAVLAVAKPIIEGLTR